jgi:lipopolysaccharide biosynthesis regulator YciM
MNVMQVTMVLVCIAIAWYIGFRSRPKNHKSGKSNVPRDYLVGLNFLLNEETDKAVDIFVKMLEVDSDTVETHLAVGKLFRRRGEVDRAIRIHQNLIARPQLERVYREQSLYELGQDYLSAGVLDRAERIFHELVNSKSYSVQALKTLIDIYQQEKDWGNALQTAIKYENVTKQSMQPVIAHYHCEIAESAVRKGQFDEGSGHLIKAFGADQASVRSSLLQASIYIKQGNYSDALRSLKKIKDQNPDYLSESVDLLALCYEKLGQEEDMVQHFRDLLEEHPRVPVVLILAERIRQWKGDKVAVTFAADYVRRYPSLRGLYMFINLYISTAEGKGKQDLQILQNLMKKVISSRPDYQCTSCGFSCRTLHWQCPGCHQWNTILPIHTLEQENI